MYKHTVFYIIFHELFFYDSITRYGRALKWWMIYVREKLFCQFCLLREWFYVYLPVISFVLCSIPCENLFFNHFTFHYAICTICSLNVCTKCPCNLITIQTISSSLNVILVESTAAPLWVPATKLQRRLLQFQI